MIYIEWPFHHNRYHYARLRAKIFVTYSPREKKIRLGRIMWAKGKPGTGDSGYSAMLSLGLQPVLFRICGEDNHLPASRDHWRLYILGVVLHHKKAYGGWIT